MSFSRTFFVVGVLSLSVMIGCGKGGSDSSGNSGSSNSSGVTTPPPAPTLLGKWDPNSRANSRTVRATTVEIEKDRMTATAQCADGHSATVEAPIEISAAKITIKETKMDAVTFQVLGNLLACVVKIDAGTFDYTVTADSVELKSTATGSRETWKRIYSY